MTLEERKKLFDQVSLDPEINTKIRMESLQFLEEAPYDVPLILKFTKAGSLKSIANTSPVLNSKDLKEGSVIVKLSDEIKKKYFKGHYTGSVRGTILGFALVEVLDKSEFNDKAKVSFNQLINIPLSSRVVVSVFEPNPNDIKQTEENRYQQMLETLEEKSKTKEVVLSSTKNITHVERWDKKVPNEHAIKWALDSNELPFYIGDISNIKILYFK